MTTAPETLDWLAAQFRSRADEDPDEHTQRDAKEVEEARACFADLLSASEEILASEGFNALDKERRSTGAWPRLFAAYDRIMGRFKEPHASERERMLDLLHRNLAAWEDEEESVQEEHEDLITDLRNFLEGK
ncbi:hypothetical protein [Rhizobium sp. SSA_523]|uniref:hypothetical protein n=1 Tax=Rhizobium sp. SSA_523 TaxID=2952477 RepID=UPI00209147B0|nr:hypothetical protein [Rhizobium sp. SSA_523]MCO5730111.1 hypothetical protein [Rhizobium sp. SSA_523]WKC25176.1 hypothetical protein QTJ18_14405 [Rhizobium sp. SSA_523]